MEEARDLADTVEAFSSEGLTLAGAAKRLHIHPNSVAYRLNRWQELTGLNPRNFSDLALSVLAVLFARENRDHDVDSA